MIDLVTALKDANIPTILVLIGAVAILLAMGVKGGIELDKANRRLAGWVGTLFLLTGMSLFVIPGTLAGNSASTEMPSGVSKSDTPSIQSTKQLSTSTPLPDQQRIEFNYDDDPSQHGWKIQRTDLLTLSITPDPQFGKFLQISSQDKSLAYLEHPFSADADAATILEIMAKTDNTTSIYVRAEVVAPNVQDPPEIWLKLTPRKVDTAEQGKEVKLGEREFFLVPENLNDGWQLIRVDLKARVQEGWQSEGYQLSKIKYLRLRGNLSLASITVFKE